MNDDVKDLRKMAAFAIAAELRGEPGWLGIDLGRDHYGDITSGGGFPSYTTRPRKRRQEPTGPGEIKPKRKTKYAGESRAQRRARKAKLRSKQKR